jgi:hypothetical protein
MPHLLLKKSIHKSYLFHKPFDHSFRIFTKFTWKTITIARSIINIIITIKHIFITSDIFWRGMSIGFYLVFSFLSPLKALLLLMYLLNFLMNGVISYLSYSFSSSSSSPLELSIIICFFLLLLPALRAMSCFLVVVTPL